MQSLKYTEFKKNSDLDMASILNKAFVFFLLLNIPSYAQNTDSCKVMLPEISSAYKGECKNGLAHGEGTAQGKDTYIGMFKRGLPDGEGKYIYADGSTFTGSFSNGLKNGKGIYRMMSDGKIYAQEGFWEQGEFVGIKDTPDKYKITNTIGIDNVTINKGKGVQNEIRIQIYGGMKRVIPDDISILRSTGELQQEGRDFIIYKYVCPFTCSIFYSINTRLGLLRKCYLDFEITEPGSYDVIITNQ